MNIRTLIISTLLASFFIALAMNSARAEKVDMTPEQLQMTATHVISGLVKDIYSTMEREGDYEVTRFIAEIVIEKVEKGDGLKAGELAYARYWRQNWRGKGTPPPGTSGHRGLPKKGDAIKVYLVNKGYNGGGDTTDGGYDVVFTNGFSVREPKATK